MKPSMSNIINSLREMISSKFSNKESKLEKRLLGIGESIKMHRENESHYSSRYIGVARANCTINGMHYPQRDVIIWLTNANNIPFQSTKEPEITISKNTKVGGVIIMGVKGRHHYKGPTGYDFDLDIYDFSTYTPEAGGSASGITIQLDGDDYIYKYQTLHHLLYDAYLLKENLKEEEEEKKRLEAERIKAQQEAAAARKVALEAEEKERQLLEEEAKRLEDEQRRKEEEEQRKEQEINRLESELQKAQERVASFRNFIRSEATLRSQHTLDPSQEKAKRSHLYDGVPLVIEGGPGTGKTTTMIQRLKFMLDVDALKDYESPLTANQKRELTEHISDNWLFFSPSPLLLRFLINNMNGEGLSAVDGKNIITINDFRNQMLSDYHLYNMDTDGPFKNYKKSAGKVLIAKPEVAIKEFEQFCVKNSVDILLAASKLETSQFSWHQDSFGIKAICNHADKVKDLEALMRLFNSLYDNENRGVVAKERELADLVNRAAVTIHTAILKDEKICTPLKEIFIKWEEERIREIEDVDEIEMDATNEEEEIGDGVNLDFEPLLFSFLKTLLRRYALLKIDKKKKLSNRQKQVLEIIHPLVEDLDLHSIGELEFFSKRFAFLCKGIESNIINQIPRLYKVYRKMLISDEAVNYYDRDLLKTIVEKDNNKYLHFDEQDLLIGFINNLAIGIRHRSKDRYEKMVKGSRYIRAYNENKKPVIGIDEATDYTILDFYLMYSFRHYEYSSVTLCGDIMQGLNKNGIRDWNALKSIMPQLEVNVLNISYRQIPTLVKMSQDIYQSERGEMPQYHSKETIKEGEPQPLVFISDDEEEKMEWIVERLREVYIAYGKEIPSVAIFIPENSNVEEFVDELRDMDSLGEIKVSAGKDTNITKAVKVYKLSEVKGMEFEVVFFYDLDKALKGNDKALVKRYLYVGISRASSHLAAIFSKKEGNEEFINYFTQEAHNWKL